MKGFRVARLLPFACIAGGCLLIASELTETFRFEAAGTAVRASDSGRHEYALLVLGIFAIAATVIAIATGSRPAAAAIAAAGLAALLVFGIVDLPDANKIGILTDAPESFLEVKTVPAGGFWLELIGALVLAVCGGALATLKPDQLKALRPAMPRRSPQQPKPEKPRKTERGKPARGLKEPKEPRKPKRPRDRRPSADPKPAEDARPSKEPKPSKDPKPTAEPEPEGKPKAPWARDPKPDKAAEPKKRRKRPADPSTRPVEET